MGASRDSYIAYLDCMANVALCSISSQSTALCSFKQEAFTYPIEIISQLPSEVSCEVKKQSPLKK